MSATAVTEFPPIALYAILSLAVAVLSLVAAFHREAITATALLEAWRHLLDTSAYLSVAAWFHLVSHLCVKSLDSISTSSDIEKFHQLMHFMILVSFVYVFYRIWRFWRENRIGPQRVMPREG